MPTPDASQFTGFRKFNAVASQNHVVVPNNPYPSVNKQINRLTSFTPKVKITTLKNFLPEINAPIFGIKTESNALRSQAKPRVNNRWYSI
jgi:hypothetical protein